MLKIQLRLIKVPDDQHPWSTNYNLLSNQEFPVPGMRKNAYETSVQALERARSVVEVHLDDNTTSNYQPNLTDHESKLVERWCEFELSSMRTIDLYDLMRHLLGVRYLIHVATDHEKYQLEDDKERPDETHRSR